MKKKTGRAKALTAAEKRQLSRVREATLARTMLVDPNAGSDVKIIKPAFSLPSVKLEIGTPLEFVTKGYCLPQMLRTISLRSNAPRPGMAYIGMAYIKSVLVGNILATVGTPSNEPAPIETREEVETRVRAELERELFYKSRTVITVDLTPKEKNAPLGDYLQDAYGEFPFELPTLSPSTLVTIEGHYTGFIPAGYPPGFPFLLTFTFSGHATIC